MIQSSIDYKLSVFAPIRQVNARVTITMDAFSQVNPYTTTRLFDDNKIISVKIVEESSILNIQSPSNQLTLTLDNSDGLFNFMSLANMQTIIASRPKIEVEFAVVLPDGVTHEWVPMGTFYVDSWKNNVGNMSITFTAHDYLLMLGKIIFPKTSITNVYTLAQAIFDNAGIEDYYIDSSISSFSGYGKETWTTNSRELLQSIAILTGTTLYQDRYGVVRLGKDVSIAQQYRYFNFTTTQNIIGAGFVGSNNFMVQSTDSGMRSISLDNQYEIPQVTLEQSIYQLNINIYEKNSGNTNTQSIFTNLALEGNNGQSFSIDIPLITDLTMAQTIADRFFSETNFNAVYVARWRQNPVLTPMDIIVVDDGVQSVKQTRVTKQEYNYSGYLTGTTESRGGI